ncbi:ComEC/Rec2 family competence protein [Spongiivirga sp. MCCC 1A20706]|uniref:ComEC/Rec2 family competence protein n=1 Tax=Spongiivirga sp. MCCC 1A20706 TaxID=3160963 RepID=UPI0039773C58
MRLFDFTIVKLTLCLILGIIISRYIELSITWLLVTGGVLLSLIFVSFISTKNQLFQHPWFAISSYTFFVFIGVSSSFISNPINKESHYTHFEFKDTITTSLQIEKVLKSTSSNHRYEAQIHQINNQKVTGKVLLIVTKDSTFSPFQIDDQLLVKSYLQPISKPKNPHQFDYAAYLENQYIYHQLYIKSGYYIPLNNKNSLSGIAAKTRNHIINRLKQHGFKNDVLAVISTLLLGERLLLPDEIRQDYINAGAIHILAISGLHVGIIYFLLQLLFGGFNKQHYRIPRTLMIIACLWCFAFIAGMSASVVRAVTMFTAVAIAVNLKRTSNTSNILFISMFFLLLFKPSFLFEVGFQLSYAAVFAIIWMQPLISKLWNPKQWFVKRFWDLTTVTISAQLGVLPLSLFYFHQFPSLFFLSNLLIIPVLGFIIGCGVLICLLAVLDILPEFLSTFYSTIISTLNNYVGWIADKEAFIFKDVSFGWLQLIGCYLVIILVYHFTIRPNSRTLISALLGIILLQSSSLVERKVTADANEFIVFDNYNNHLIGIKNGKTLVVHSKVDSLITPLKSYKIGERIEKIQFRKTRHLYEINDQKILVLTKETKQLPEGLNPNIIVLDNSPKHNIDQIIVTLQPSIVIATANNYPSFINRWKESARKKQVYFHSTNEQGAFRLKF